MAVEDAISFWTDIQRYENMLAADPRSYCFVPLSELYRKLGLLDDAISVALKGCGLHPDYPGGFFALGAAYQAKGENAEARKALETSVSLKPEHAEALKLLGKVYIEEGRTDLAEQVLGQALQLDPQDAETTLTLRSIGAAPAAATPAAEEELEELDLVEELTEELEPGPEAEIEGMAGVEPAYGGAAARERGAETTNLWDDEDFNAFQEVDEPAVSAAPSFAPSGRSAERQPGGKDPLATATMAELYVSQGFLDKAISIYRQLLSEEPANQSYLQRGGELARLREQQLQPSAAPAAPQPPQPAPAAPAAPVTHELSQPTAQQGATPAAQQEAPRHQAPAWEEPTAAQVECGTPLAGEAAAGPVDLESELTRWLGNIRRRRDGV